MTYLDFKNKYTGVVIDYDGQYGGQCWDLAQKYFTEALKLPANILGGCGLVSNMLKEPKLSLMLQYFDEVKVTEMQPGDVVIWAYGHVAIFDNWDGKACNYFSQNPNKSNVIPITKGGNRAFRIKGAKPVEPVKPVTPVEQPIKVGDSVIVTGIGRANSVGSGVSTKQFINHAMKVIKIVDGRAYAYALNQYNTDSGITAWFKKESIRK